MVTFHLFRAASTSQAAASFLTSSSVRHGLLRILGLHFLAIAAVEPGKPPWGRPATRGSLADLRAGGDGLVGVEQDDLARRVVRAEDQHLRHEGADLLRR